MNVQSVTRAIQLILAPVVMVTSCAILVGGLLTRYSEINVRMRALTRERLDLLRAGDDTLTLTALAGDQFKSERLSEVDTQLPELLRRHELVHRSVLAIYLAIVIFLLSMLAIALAIVPNSSLMAAVALFVFLAGTLVVLYGVLLISVEVRRSSDAVSYEVTRVLRLGGSPSDPGAGSEAPSRERGT